MSLFIRYDRPKTLHSGGESNYLIDCNALTDEDLAAIARRLSELTGPFGGILWVPRGGERIGRALELYVSKKSHTLLLVDDVWTTGSSLTEVREKIERDTTRDHWKTILGAVIFVRGRTAPDWVYAFAFVDL